jgi:putrescine aminotransferase
MNMIEKLEAQGATIDTAAWKAMDAAHFLHPFTDHKKLHEEKSRIIVRGQGVHLWDSEGTKIFDAMAGLWCTAVGYGREELAEAASAQMRQLPFYNAFFKTATMPAIELATRLAELAGPGFEHVFFATSGSEAVDTIIRLARHYWRLEGQPAKQFIIGREYGYHGSTLAGASAGGMADMHRQGGDLPGFSQIMPPYWYGYGEGLDPAEFGLKAARALEDRILELGADTVAAFIGEPIQGAGGVIIPPETYWPEIQRICRKYDILLIADEVISGFGRTGQWFGSQTFGIQPDLISLAKGITSGYVPLSAVMVGDRVADVLISKGGEFHHGFTYSGHPVSCAVALANLDIMEREGLVARARVQGEKLHRQLTAALGDHPLVGEIRMTGLIGAIELVRDKRERRFFASEQGVGMICRNHCFGNNLVMRAVRDTMVFAPALTISDPEIEEFVGLVAKAVDLTLADLRRAHIFP